MLHISLQAMIMRPRRESFLIMKPLGIVNAMVIEKNMALNWKMQFYSIVFTAWKKLLAILTTAVQKTLKANCLTGCLYYIVLEPFLYHWDRAIFYKYMTIEKWWTCNWLHFIAVSKKKFFRISEIQRFYQNLRKFKNIL